ncbi:MAG: Rne/Rng family ribonuclease, partial [Elusimicrobia bacterium]|nr:Rne/Rng family ribonuclease [Elusimicrobiota bacterium]
TRVAIVEDNRLVELLWERKNAKSIVGNIYKGRVENVLPGISSAFINIGFEKNAYLYISDVHGDTRKPIDTLLKKGQEVMVQVAKEAIGTKGAKVTMEVTLPGRYLVFTPYSQFVGISKHIADPVERKRISEAVDRLMETTLKGKGVVVRTEAEGASEEDLNREAEYLVKTWDGIEKAYNEKPGPQTLHQDLDIALAVARDLLTEDVYVYLIDDKKVYERVIEFIGTLSPELSDRVRYYDGKTPLFTAFNIEPEIEKIRSTKVTLPSGGTIVIQEAESLCAIDVNTGRFTGSRSQEETVTLNNVEAAAEVAHQLRLRNIGGLIVIDFIDMKKQSNRQKVMEALAEAVRRDRAKIRILPITRLGLIEMTRERRKESTVSLMTDECPECYGSGRVLSVESMRIGHRGERAPLGQDRPGRPPAVGGLQDHPGIARDPAPPPAAARRRRPPRGGGRGRSGDRGGQGRQVLGDGRLLRRRRRPLPGPQGGREGLWRAALLVRGQGPGDPDPARAPGDLHRGLGRGLRRRPAGQAAPADAGARRPGVRPRGVLLRPRLRRGGGARDQVQPQDPADAGGPALQRGPAALVHLPGPYPGRAGAGPGAPLRVRTARGGGLPGRHPQRRHRLVRAHRRRRRGPRRRPPHPGRPAGAPGALLPAGGRRGGAEGVLRPPAPGHRRAPAPGGA